ncbi:MAG: type III-A CRISPR-associated protein Cas10/Csm1 [Anaerolineae bacterium]|nr:type III-A CRISPR-associated protein Cas10/Csm1 [Anaerolineae bacterium]
MTNLQIANLRTALCNYVLSILGLPHSEAAFDLTPFLDLLPSGDGRVADIFATLAPAEHPFPFHPQPNLLESLAALKEQVYGSNLHHLSRPDTLPDPATAFDLWASLIDIETAGVPGWRGEAGVSLSHEFKLLSAVSHACRGDASRLNDGFQLVVGDFPGVQRVIYTITSDGATKGVRGRSFFLQLLAECVARRILAERDLPMTNALYIAGSKFLLLLDAEAQVDGIAAAINDALLETFEGDLSLVLVNRPLSKEGISNAGALAKVYSALKGDETRHKTQPFRHQRHSLFSPFGIGSEFACAISRREPRSKAELDEAQNADGNWIAWEQQAFEKLAVDLAGVGDEPHYLVFSAQAPGNHEKSYPQLLHQLTGWTCSLVDADTLNRNRNLGYNANIVALNRVDINPLAVHGIRFIAAHTPRVSADDAAWWRKKYGNDEQVYAGSIRNFELLATRGQDISFARYGVLRMDVDSLGSAFSHRLTNATLTRRVALSNTMSRFFEGFLPRICWELEHGGEPLRPDSLYLIYGGGDDLFVVGEWELLPVLAERIHNLFEQYCGGAMTISAGIEVVPAHFPFYVVAELAKTALDDNAKESRAGKNAICLFNEVFNWEVEGNWQHLCDLKNEIIALQAEDDKQTIIRNLLNIYNQWLADCRRYQNADLRFGPFVWRACYQLSRVRDANRGNAAYQSRIENLITQVTTNPRLCGIAARWADFELRSQTKTI